MAKDTCRELLELFFEKISDTFKETAAVAWKEESSLHTRGADFSHGVIGAVFHDFGWDLSLFVEYKSSR